MVVLGKIKQLDRNTSKPEKLGVKEGNGLTKQPVAEIPKWSATSHTLTGCLCISWFVLEKINVGEGWDKKL